MANYSEQQVKHLDALGIHSEEVPENVLDYYKNEINNVKEPSNLELAGHIKKELKFTNVPWDVEQYLTTIPYKKFYFNRQLKNVQVNAGLDSTDTKLTLSSNWVNFQKKYEFNPIHNHSGLFSFIIFLKIPYDYEEEAKSWNNHTSVGNVASCLQFLYVDSLGQIQVHTLPVDKSFEGKIVYFSAKQNHCVYPFYTSDDERITVSGNIKFHTGIKETTTNNTKDYIL